tara:strand:- start:2251 stop:2472 length:222 start_codon:yes stop_codon:yes gene_type:complete
MTTIVLTIVAALGAVFYFIRIGKKLQKSSGLQSALSIHGKINREKAKIEESYQHEMERKSESKPRDFFNNGSN